MHTKDARGHGEAEQRLYALPVWHETPFFTDRERAALAWTQAITLLAGHPVTEELYHAVLIAAQYARIIRDRNAGSSPRTALEVSQ
jgi:alkylhydroperoxidase family enzyme